MHYMHVEALIVLTPRQVRMELLHHCLHARSAADNFSPTDFLCLFFKSKPCCLLLNP
jgi:hypothetical protein